MDERAKEDEGGALGSFWGFVAINFELPGDQSESRANDIRACTLSVSFMYGVIVHYY